MNNNFIFIGRLTRDPELRYTSSNKAVTQIDLAVQNRKDDVTFVPITLFGNIAENVHKYCEKGDQVGFQGIVKNHNWEDEEGKKHFTYNFIANRVEFISKASKSTNKVGTPQEQAKNGSNE